MVATAHSTRTAKLRWLWIPCLALSCFVLFCFALGHWVYEPFIFVPIVLYSYLPFTIAVLYGFTLCVWLGLYLKKKISSTFYGLGAFCVSFILFGGLVFYSVRIYNPLPNDEQMIENFKANRADFVEAVRRYREYPQPKGKDTSQWYPEGDTLEVYERAGIDRIDSTSEVWLPDPYSMETGKKIIHEINKGHGRALFHQYGAIQITPMPHLAYSRNTCLGTIRKDYRFFPEVPRIENDELLGPVNHLGKSRHSRVLSSLNRLPVPWERPGCVYRQIEPQWFIRMCRSRGLF